ncbi:NAD(P)/FAD-dependent oxidoreductase [Marinimicrococcus flavescens]|uniref:NAD(P)/FAD-dependent oxidoreductase n=1 Tax=Marinimicrococcus flavescens TaxID=3031815 RepID=A0AAP3UYV1_9PROT|nr:NAD(P)/FAD-dependent oxidoreductase [Marinimicrococcus flavescens]
MDRVDCVVVGAGVVGLAVARRLAMAGREVIVLDKEPMIGTETSSRNSEVIHAGIYYAQGSLKARLCIEGKEFLYRYCAARGVPHKRCGKLIVATSEEQLATLEKIRANAARIGMPDLEAWSAARAMELEPSLSCTGALWSPTTGIIDSHGLMLAYQGDAERHGAMLAFNAPLERARVTDEGIALEVGGDEPMSLMADMVVNSAGLHAPALARRIEGLPGETVPGAFYCKGNYYTLPGRSPFSRLIYPVPEQAGLGVHVTVDMGGQCRFGPDTEWVGELNYDVDPRRADVFYEEVRKYWPALKDGVLEPGYSGIRPKITPQGAPAADFVISGPDEHGVAGLVNLFGIESPGLTASWAVARETARKLGLPELAEEVDA